MRQGLRAWQMVQGNYLGLQQWPAHGSAIPYTSAFIIAACANDMLLLGMALDAADPSLVFLPAWQS